MKKAYIAVAIFSILLSIKCSDANKWEANTLGDQIVGDLWSGTRVESAKLNKMISAVKDFLPHNEDERERSSSEDSGSSTLSSEMIDEWGEFIEDISVSRNAEQEKLENIKIFVSTLHTLENSIDYKTLEVTLSIIGEKF